jgi:mRNA interferase MazF
VQSNAFNESRIASVIVAVITSNLGIATAPGNVRLSKADSVLANPSVVNISQLFTIDRGLLTRKVQALPAQALQEVEAGLTLVLGL